MHKEVINKKTECLLAEIAKTSFIRDFYLAGGTALALQYGHRKSIDLDWFSPQWFNAVELKGSLVKIGKIIIDSEEKNTLNLDLNGVKLSFLNYPYKLIFPLVDWQGIKLADHRDIACMKLDAVSSRGSKKDFIDLYFFLQTGCLSDLMNLFEKKYKGIKFNKLHILKSLTYFIEADECPMPIMLKDVKWSKVREYFQNIAKEEVI
ncbi:MAG: nucleotidyl transferase AbiEii/AbiGii toxin family protein [bacterium]